MSTLGRGGVGGPLAAQLVDGTDGAEGAAGLADALEAVRDELLEVGVVRTGFHAADEHGEEDELAQRLGALVVGEDGRQRRLQQVARVEAEGD